MARPWIVEEGPWGEKATSLEMPDGPSNSWNRALRIGLEGLSPLQWHGNAFMLRQGLGRVSRWQLHTS